MKFFLNLYFLSPVVVFFYKQRGLTFFQILSLESIFVLVTLFFEVPTGVFADKYGRKKSVAMGTFLISLGSFIYLFANSFLLFSISFAIEAVGMTFLSGTIEALIYDHLKRRKEVSLVKRVMGNYEAAGLLAMVVASVFGSWIARDLLPGQFEILIVLSFSAMFLGFVVSLLIEDTPEKRVEEESPFLILREGIGLIRENKPLSRIVLLGIFTSPFPFILGYLFQPYLKNAGIRISLLGVVLSVALLLSSVSQRYAYKIEELMGVRRGIFFATFVPGLLYLLMSFVFHPFWSTAVFVLLKASMGIRDPLFSAYKNFHIPSRMRATVLSLITLLSSLYQIFVRLIVGKLVDYNLSFAFLLMGVLVMTASVVLRIDENHVETAIDLVD